MLKEKENLNNLLIRTSLLLFAIYGSISIGRAWFHSPNSKYTFAAFCLWMILAIIIHFKSELNSNPQILYYLILLLILSSKLIDINAMSYIALAASILLFFRMSMILYTCMIVSSFAWMPVISFFGNGPLYYLSIFLLILIPIPLIVHRFWTYEKTE